MQPLLLSNLPYEVRSVLPGDGDATRIELIRIKTWFFPGERCVDCLLEKHSGVLPGIPFLHRWKECGFIGIPEEWVCDANRIIFGREKTEGGSAGVLSPYAFGVRLEEERIPVSDSLSRGFRIFIASLVT